MIDVSSTPGMGVLIRFEAKGKEALLLGPYSAVHLGEKRIVVDDGHLLATWSPGGWVVTAPDRSFGPYPWASIHGAGNRSDA